VSTTGLAATASQAVFRVVLDAMAHPGEILRFPGPADGDMPPALLPVLSLADLSTAVCVLASDARWAGLVATATGAAVRPLEEAGLVAALDALEPQQLRVLRTGSAAAPEQGAQVFIAVSGLAEPGPLRLSGPGIAGERRLAVDGLPDGFWAARAGLVRDFPAGIDLVFATPDGQVAAVPRSTAVIEEGH
jgi:alpha-D-ribose 1-methylphosphonate 5-triphosphate synthase subunit PhnH